jgi:plastocyanin
MKFYSFCAGLVLPALLIACSGDSGSPDATATTAPIGTPERTASSSGGAGPIAAASPEPSATPEPSSTPEPTATAEPEPTATTPPAPTSAPAPTSPPAPASPPAPTGVAAPIQGYGFPYQLTVAAGTTVVWTNYDSVLHDVTANDDSWTSGLLAQGESFARTFNTAGKYAYVCRVHPYMTAVLIVE